MKNKFFVGFKSGVLAYREAVFFLSKNRLLYFFLFPLIFNVLIYTLGFYFTDQFIDLVNTKLVSYISIVTDEYNTVASKFIVKFLNIASWIFSKIIFTFLFTLFGGYITIILLSPVFSFLSEKTANIIHSQVVKFDFIQLLTDIFRALIIAIRNITVQLIIYLVLLLIGIIPLFGWIIAFLGNLIIASYFYGFSFLDYSNERHQLTIKKSVDLVRRNKGFAIGLGLVFQLCLLIPIIGSLVASFLSIIAVVSATIATEHKKIN